MPVARRLEDDADEMPGSARKLSSVVRWALLTDGDTLSSESRAYVSEALSDLRGVLGELSQLIDRLPAE